jgi:hypothetical protein
MRRALRSAALLGVLGLVAVFLAACGGAEETEPAATSVAPSPTPAPAGSTAEERDAAGPILMASALLAEDLPEGFTLDEEKYLSNEDSINEERDYSSVATLEDLNRWGQILQYIATYSRPAPPTLTGATLSLKEITALYRDEAGARSAFEFERMRASSPERLLDALPWPANSDLNAGEASVSPISVGGMGDDRAAVQIEVTGSLPDVGSELKFFGQLLLVRRGREIGSIATVAVGSPHPVKELEALARTLDERMKAALE